MPGKKDRGVRGDLEKLKFYPLQSGRLKKDSAHASGCLKGIVRGEGGLDQKAYVCFIIIIIIVIIVFVCVCVCVRVCARVCVCVCMHVCMSHSVSP